MKISDLEYDQTKIDAFKKLEAFNIFEKEITEDFNTVYADYLKMDIPVQDDPEREKIMLAGLKVQKTDLFCAFVQGTVNFFNDDRALTKRMTGYKGSEGSRLILPSHYENRKG